MGNNVQDRFYKETMIRCQTMLLEDPVVKGLQKEMVLVVNAGKVIYDEKTGLRQDEETESLITNLRRQILLRQEEIIRAFGIAINQGYITK